MRKAKVFNSLWESLWKASKIKGFLRVFHRENSLFLWKTFLISLGNDCGNCLNREKQQNRKRILTAKNAAFHANRSHPAEPYREISVGWPGGKKSDTLSLPHNPGVVSCTEGRNVSATIVYVMAAHLFTEWPVQNSRALARCVGIIAACMASALVPDKTLENFPHGKFSRTCPLCWNYNCLHGKCISIAGGSAFPGGGPQRVHRPR